MTDRAEARDAIVAAVITGWGTTTPYAVDNVDLDTRNLKEWIHVSVRHTGGGQSTVGKAGNRRFVMTGSAFVRVHVQAGAGGTARADELAQRAQRIFEGVALAGTTVHFDNVLARELGPVDEWYQVLVEAEFQYEYIR